MSAKSVSIVMPAYMAETTIAGAVDSVLAQTHAAWELIIVADDEADYEAVLGRAGIRDDRIRHFSTGGTGSGSPPARNIGLEAAQYRYSAILDADDRFYPQKLERALAQLEQWGIVSSALDVLDPDGTRLRTVGEGPSMVLPAGDYKFTNLSMDSMLVYDRHKADPRFNPDFPCLTDIEFLLKLLAANEAVYHLGTVLHAYVKQPMSVSNKPGASATMVATKKRLLRLLQEGAYPLADPDGVAGMVQFYEISLQAEQTYGPMLAEQPGLLFEDHLEPLLRVMR